MTVIVEEFLTESMLSQQFSEIFMEELTARGKTLEALSNETGIPIHRLYTMSTGGTMPHPLMIYRISLALCCTMDHLLGLSTFRVG